MPGRRRRATSGPPIYRPGVHQLRGGCALVVATAASMGATVVAFGEALQTGGRTWIAVALGAALFLVCLAIITRTTKRR